MVFVSVVRVRLYCTFCLCIIILRILYFYIYIVKFMYVVHTAQHKMIQSTNYDRLVAWSVKNCLSVVVVVIVSLPFYYFFSTIPPSFRSVYFIVPCLPFHFFAL